MEGEKGKVRVTGDAGYFGSWLVMRLLQQGYFVNTTVRSEIQEETSHLKALSGATERLKIFEAELSDPQSFEAALEGCEGVFHVAHPIIINPKDPENMVMKPAIVGTIGIKTIQSDRELCEALKKIQFVHIDDLASAHIFLMECPEATGRYICSAVDATMHSLAKFFQHRYPQLPIATGKLDEMEEEEPTRVSSKKLLALGFKFKCGLDEMFDGAIRCCKEKGFL